MAFCVAEMVERVQSLLSMVRVRWCFFWALRVLVMHQLDIVAPMVPDTLTAATVAPVCTTLPPNDNVPRPSIIPVQAQSQAPEANIDLPAPLEASLESLHSPEIRVNPCPSNANDT